MTMALELCRLDDRWYEAASERAIEVFVCHSHLHQAVGAELSSYRACDVAVSYHDVLDVLSFVAIDR